MKTMQDYKCPCCGGAIAFDTESQKMKCPYCYNEFDVETLKQYDQEFQDQSADDMKWETPASQHWQDGE